MAFGKYVEIDAEGNATYECPDNELFRPAPGGSGYAPAIALAPGFCSLSMLFSDWDGSGRRDLRVSNDRQYYDARSARSSCGEWRKARPRASTPPMMAGFHADLGDGHRQL